MQPVIREARDTKDRELVLTRWGLIPFFTKALSDVKGISTINARAETIATSGTYREPSNVAAALSLPTDSTSGHSPPSPLTVTGPRSRPKKRLPISYWSPSEPTKSNPPARLRTALTWPTASLLPLPVFGTHGRNRSDPLRTLTTGCNPSRSSPRSLTNSPPRSTPECLSSCAPATTTAGLAGKSPTAKPAEEMGMHRAHQDVGNVKNNSPELLNSV